MEKNIRIRKDDKVMVIAGKDKGKIGKVIRLIKKHDTVLVEKINVVKRHQKGNPYTGQAGGIVEKEAPIHVSNVQVMCDACAKPSRVGYKIDEEGRKTRVCKRCGEAIK